MTSGKPQSKSKMSRARPAASSPVPEAAAVSGPAPPAESVAAIGGAAPGASIAPAVKSRTGLGIALVLAATFIFAWQDAVTKTLVAHYPVSFVVMVRGWIFLIAGLLFLHFSFGGVEKNIKTKRPVLQVMRGLLITCQWLLAGTAIHYLGLAESTALYEAYPLFGTVLAIFILHEQVGWRRILGLSVGFLGILIMVRPGAGVVSGGAVYGLAAALTFAFYMVLTRLAAADDEPQTSFFYMGAVPGIVMSLFLPFIWQPVALGDIWLFALLGALAVSAHFCMIKALTVASVGLLQPFNYFQLVWSIIVGFVIFGNLPDKYVVIGASLVVMSGIFVLFRGQVRKPKIIIRRRKARALR